MAETVAPDLVWYKTYGGSRYDEGFCVVPAGDGGYAIVGMTNSFNDGLNFDVYLLKTDADGNLLWNKTYGGMVDDAGFSIVRADDGGFAIAGSTDSYGKHGYHIYLLRIDADGNLLWNKTYGGTGDDRGESIVMTMDGGYAIAGMTSSFGNGSYDIYLVRTDADGNLLWNKTYGGTSYDRGSYVIQTKDGGFAVIGMTMSVKMPSDHYRDTAHVYLLKTDANGNLLWNKTYGENITNIGYSVIQTSDGGYAIIGIRSSLGFDSASPIIGNDIFLIKTDAEGNILWNRTYGGENINNGYSFVQAKDGGYVIVGSSDLRGRKSIKLGNTGLNLCLIKTDSGGNQIWNETFDGITTEDGHYSIIQADDGGFVIAGHTTTLDVNGKPLSPYSNVSRKVILMKTSAESNIMPSILPAATPSLDFTTSAGILATASAILLVSRRNLRK